MSKVPISSFCRTTSGGTPLREKGDLYYGGDIPWVKSGELRESIVTHTEETITELALEESAAKIVPAGAVLVAMYGATVGRVGLLGVDAATNQAICSIIPDPTKADAKYMFHCLQAEMPQFLSKRNGGAQPNISQEIIRNTKIALPHLEEQRRIATILDQVEALRAKRRQTLAKLDTLTQSLFIEMFGATEQSHLVSLDELIVDGPQNGLYRPASDYGSGIPILRIDAFYDGEISDLSSLKRLRIPDSEIARYRLVENDIIINRVNSLDYLGKTALVRGLTEPTVFESNMMRLHLNEQRIDPTYAIQALQARSVRAQILSRAKKAVNQASINQEDVRSLQIPVPALEHQIRFGEVVKSISFQATKAQHGREKIDQLLAGLQESAFRGGL